MGNQATRPEDCTMLDFECIQNIRDTFCICKTPLQIDVVDGKEHKNTHRLCINPPGRDWAEYKINSGDMELIVRMMLKALSVTENKFNLRWYLGKNFSIDGDIVNITEA